MSLPEHLRSTGELLRAAYPDGLVESDYSAILVLLYDHLSDRNLADVVSEVFGKDDGVAYNDILKAVTVCPPSAEALSRARARLARAGFEAWLAEDAC